jgi:hypothetical protein
VPAGSVLLTFAVAAVGGVLSALLTMLATPRLQFRFWRCQRRTELQLETIREVSRLAAEYLNFALAKPNEPPSSELFQGFIRAEATVRPLFSAAAFQAFMRMQRMVGSGFGEGNRTADAFVAARDAALAALYAEALPIPPQWLRWLW